MGKAYFRIICIQKFRCILGLSDNKLNLNSDLVFAHLIVFHFWIEFINPLRYQIMAYFLKFIPCFFQYRSDHICKTNSLSFISELEVLI